MGDSQETTNKKESGIKKYFSIALVVFLTFCACLAVFIAFYRYQGMLAAFGNLMHVLQPIIIGLVLAYLLNPVMMFVEKGVLKLLDGRLGSRRKEKKVARVIGTFGAVVFLVLIIGLLIEMMLPQLIESISGMLVTLPSQVNSFIDWINGYIKSDNSMAADLEEMLRNVTNYLKEWAETTLLPDVQNYITSVTSGVFSFFKMLLNAIIGVIISVYVMMSKEKFVGQSKKVLYAVFKPSTANTIIETARMSHKIFGGFITGKILDSAIIGLLCYIVLSIMQMPYTLLVSAIVGVTNIIPFFGPFIGAIPSFIIIVLASPMQGLYFLIAVLILQQVDGNIIGPKILGDSTGLTSFWVVFAIMVGGGLFGFIGMLLGVPTFAVIYYLVKKAVNHWLRKRHLSTETDDYIYLDSVDKHNNTMIYPKKEEITVEQEEAVASAEEAAMETKPDNPEKQEKNPQK
ncbi:MAG: AI-2E family transporter [Lachnospiraceae bacterium]|nr:AI-2E family transporter [Lachnospiraceae bacterium]